MRERKKRSRKMRRKEKGVGGRGKKEEGRGRWGERVSNTDDSGREPQNIFTYSL